MRRILPQAPPALLVLALLAPLPALSQDAEPCRQAIAQTERATGVPDRLMQAIALMESGRRSAGRLAAWPWTINVEGVGEVFDTKQQAIAAVQAHQARGARSIDVGCMQVNLMHHPTAFSSLDEAFDPAANARYAAGFLQQLLAQTGSWPLAVAGYHSLTPAVGGDYARKVLAIWAQPDTRTAAAPGVPLSAPGSAPSAAGPAAVPPPALPFGGTARFAALPPPRAGAAGTQRSLDSYRAAPTQLAASLAFRRS